MVDVIVVGAGIAGICGGYYVRTTCPDRSLEVLEARDRIGGTWDLFRYPGIRSDSDMYTLGFSFRPWPDAKGIADGASIREYLQHTVAETGLDAHIRLGLRMVHAAWSSEDRAVRVARILDANVDHQLRLRRARVDCVQIEVDLVHTVLTQLTAQLRRVAQQLNGATAQLDSRVVGQARLEG